MTLRLAILFLSLLPALAGAAELRGHGGPVRAIAVSADGATIITGSFDTRAILWSPDSGEARQVLLFHEGQVNAVAALGDGRFATAGEDSRIAIWQEGQPAPIRIFEGHSAPIAALAVSPDGSMLASASWDRTVRLWPLSGDGAPRTFEGHDGNVNAVVFLSDGALASAGYDSRLILRPLDGEGAPVAIEMPTPLNALAALPGDRLAVAGGDGFVRIVGRDGDILAEAPVASTPVVALAVTEDGGLIATASLRDGVTILDASDLSPIRSLAAVEQAIWALAFTDDGRTLLAGGSGRVVRRWDVETGQPLDEAGAGSEDLLAAYEGDRGAEIFRACVACHTLDPSNGNRAGPTLHGLFGREIASLPGYRYSDALEEMDIVWTPETVSELFEIGPATYTPGTKMPEQRIGSAEDRAALIRFLERATAD
ncbi:c-type cytochrome [Inquilinus sp. CAU 1745]|uniref:c-type cytochrome n=1 Tax=Inquilinus sp. CAU 1745 TaxID=3140369 RepID=UPI00325B66DA